MPIPVFGNYTESLMSRGSTVQKHHYLTALEALTQLTTKHIAKEEWQLQ